jgi:single-strand DNA-binding protein
MMASYNRCQFVGNIGKPAEMKYTSNGKPLTSFSIAVQNGWGDNKTTDWWDVKMWGERGEKIVQYLDKGTTVLVEGRLEKRQWSDDQGVTHHRVDVIASDIVLLGGKREGSGGGWGDGKRPAQTAARKPQSAPFGEDEELPF